MNPVKSLILAVLLISFLIWNCSMKEKKTNRLNLIDRDSIYTQLIQICDKIIDWNVGSGKLEDIHDNSTTSIFINGNMARVLICTYELTGKQEFLEEGLRYCKFLAEQAFPVTTSKGNQAYWWYDQERTKNLYLADTGTAMTAFYKAIPYLNENERALILSRLDGFFRLITEGTSSDPTNLGLAASPGWVCKDSGALGVGYYRGQLEIRPYTVSTAQAGLMFATLYYQITKNPETKKIAINAAAWLLNCIGSDGGFEYRICGEVLPEYKFQATHYTIEALCCFFDLIKDEHLKKIWNSRFPALLDFILSQRNSDGLWGINREYDAQRSVFLMLAMTKAKRTGIGAEEIQTAICKGLTFLQSARNAYDYGINVLIRQTGFIGLVYADMLKESITYTHPKKTEVPSNISELNLAAQKLTLKMNEFEKTEFSNN